MNEKQTLSSEQIQAKLKNLQQSTGQQGGASGEVEITVASQRDAFNLKMCQELLEQHSISSQLVGHGFNRVVVVARGDSSRAIDCYSSNIILTLYKLSL